MLYLRVKWVEQMLVWYIFLYAGCVAQHSAHHVTSADSRCTRWSCRTRATVLTWASCTHKGVTTDAPRLSEERSLSYCDDFVNPDSEGTLLRCLGMWPEFLPPSTRSPPHAVLQRSYRTRPSCNSSCMKPSDVEVRIWTWCKRSSSRWTPGVHFPPLGPAEAPLRRVVFIPVSLLNYQTIRTLNVP